MVVLIRKSYLEVTALLLIAVAGMAVILWQGRDSIAAFADEQAVHSGHVVVIDAGHGGEDGGAVGADGTIESGLNLDIALKLNNLMEFLGQNTVMTRSDDVSIYSDEAKTLHQKKVSDLKNRVAIVNNLQDSVLISIHQNSLPNSKRTHGAQVFFNKIEPASILAASIQDHLNQNLNAGNEKMPKKIPESIFLTKNVLSPAIIVECGFLSNAQDTVSLKKPNYQLHLAAIIAAGYFSTKEL